MSQSHEDLIRLYKETASTLGQRERAEFERQIWEIALPVVDTGKTLRRVWLAAQLDETQNDIEHRSVIYNGGLAAEELWKHLDEGMPLVTAVGLLRKAKKAATVNRIAMREAVRAELAEYEKLPIYRMASGKVTRRRPPSMLPNLKDVMPKRKRGRPAKHDGEHARSFWASIREQMAEFVAARLVGADPIVAQSLWKNFERDLKILFDDLQGRLYRARREKQKDVQIGRKTVVNACLTLSMDPPSPGKPIDLVLAKKQKHKLSRLYHPDQHNGDESLRPQYEAVFEAYSVLEQYQDSFGNNISANETKEAGGIG